MAHKLAWVSLFLVCAILSQPASAQRGGGGGGGGGGQCNGGSNQASSNIASSISPYTQFPMANAYALQQMQQQQYAQQAMAMRQVYAQLQMENQLFRAQMMQLQNKEQLAQAKSPVNAQGDSNTLLASKKDLATAAKKKASSKSRSAAQRAKQQPAAVESGKLALNEIN